MFGRVFLFNQFVVNVKTNVNVLTNRIDLAQYDKDGQISVRVSKICDSVTNFLILADFHPALQQ